MSKNIKLQTKKCITCSREFNNRKSWESRGLWKEVKYCSDACKKFKDNLNYKSKFNKN